MKCETNELRLFIAVDLDDKNRRKLEGAIEDLRHIPARVKWVDPSRMHLTLVFIGSTPTENLGQVKDAVSRSVKDMAPFECSLKGLGFFGSPRSPRVIWAGLAGETDPLRRIRGNLEGELTKAEVDFDRKDFRPHLTLGRVKSRKGTQELVERIQKMADLDLGVLQVDSVTLFESRLEPGGAVHLARHEAPLSG